jgi:phospholipid/cholesterol/gamma-HCH transport system permease protein
MANETTVSLAPTGPTALPADIRPLKAALNPFVVVLTFLGEILILLWRAIKAMRGGVNAKDLLEQMSSLGANSVSIALLTSTTSGAVLALYFAPFLKQYGAEGFTGAVVALAIARELGPVLTGVVVAARAGSAIAAELGTMKVTEQIDALRALAVNPIQYLVVPRILAAVIMVPLVCALADAGGIYGGYLLSKSEGVLPTTYLNSMKQFIDPSDFVKGIIKTVVFGLIIALVGCHQGLATRGGATEVGRATTNAVVLSIVLIYLANFVLTYFMFSVTVSL